ncbi:MAG: DNA polymerase III subunit gamma/tau C-terminal domain-containing protein, partial [Gammaproteobacteria bacterium]
HMLSSHSFNALLKTLEEPPPHVKFLLATTDPQKLLPTVLSRCLQFNLKRISGTEIADHLADVLTKESISFESPALKLIAGAADGSMRDALSLLDQGIAFGGGSVIEESIRSMLGSIEQHKIIAVLDALANNDATALMACVEDVAQHLGDFEKLLAEILTTLQKIAVVQVAPDTMSDDLEDSAATRALAARISPEDIQLYYQIALIGRRDLPLSPEPRGGLEMVLLRMLAFRPARKAAPSRVESDKVKVVSQINPVVSAPVQAEKKIEKPPVKETPGANDAWELLVEKLQLKGVLKQLAMNCACQSREGGRWVLTLEQSNHQLFSVERQKRLNNLLCDALGSEVTLTINISGEQVESPAAAVMREKKSRQAEAIAEIEADPNIQAIKDVFDATVHQDSIRPVD